MKIIENHQAFILLHNCFAHQELQHILRVSHAYSYMEKLEKLDNILTIALVTAAYIILERASLVQVVLPVGLRGIRIRMPKDIALPALISSLYVVPILRDGILNNITYTKKQWSSGCGV